MTLTPEPTGPQRCWPRRLATIQLLLRTITVTVDGATFTYDTSGVST